MGILRTATFCANRLKRYPSVSDRELKNEGRGYYHCRSDVNSGVT